MLKPQELVRKVVERELKEGDCFKIYTEGEVDTTKWLEYNVDHAGNGAFYIVEMVESEDVADSSIILCNEFEPM